MQCCGMFSRKEFAPGQVGILRITRMAWKVQIKKPYRLQGSVRRKGFCLKCKMRSNLLYQISYWIMNLETSLLVTPKEIHGKDLVTSSHSVISLVRRVFSYFQMILSKSSEFSWLDPFILIRIVWFRVSSLSLLLSRVLISFMSLKLRSTVAVVTFWSPESDLCWVKRILWKIFHSALALKLQHSQRTMFAPFHRNK